MRAENEIKKRLKLLKQNKVTGGPYSELKPLLGKQLSKLLSGSLKKQKTY